MDTAPFSLSSFRLVCATPDLWAYLSSRTGKICTSEEKAGREICRLLSVRRIRDISDSPQALKAWKTVSAEFSLWLKRTYSPVTGQTEVDDPGTVGLIKSEWPPTENAADPVSYCSLKRVGPFISAFRLSG